MVEAQGMLALLLFFFFHFLFFQEKFEVKYKYFFVLQCASTLMCIEPLNIIMSLVLVLTLRLRNKVFLEKDLIVCEENLIVFICSC